MVYNNKKPKATNKKNNKKLQQILEKGENLSRVITLLDLNTQFSIIKNHEVYKETGKYAHSKEKNKSTETVHEKDLTDLLGNDFKTINLQILKQSRESVKKSQKNYVLTKWKYQ